MRVCCEVEKSVVIFTFVLVLGVLQARECVERSFEIVVLQSVCISARSDNAKHCYRRY